LGVGSSELRAGVGGSGVWGLGCGDWGLEIGDWGLEVGGSGFGGLGFRGWGLQEKVRGLEFWFQVEDLGFRSRGLFGKGQPLSLTLSFSEIPWFNVPGKIQRCDWSTTTHSLGMHTGHI